MGRAEKGAGGTEDAARVHATVVYCTADEQHVVAVDLAPGSTLRDAVRASGLLELPELGSQPLDLGVFNRPRPAGTLLRDGDRVEIYRPLSVDPKQARRLRAEVRRRRSPR
jgi:putative ubiquitin-RnfH superfamily antitoxin RatB of RatAB toxin-antitoxin module